MNRFERIPIDRVLWGQIEPMNDLNDTDLN